MSDAQTSDVAAEPVEEAESLVGLLNQLAEVPDPAPVSMMPQTAGWLVIGLLLLLALSWQAFRKWRHYQANAYRRDALRALVQAGDDPVAISVILKRVAMTAYGRGEVAALSGQAWLRFLDATGGGEAFRQGAGRVLAHAAYVPEPAPASAEVVELAQQWVRGHVSRAEREGDV